MTGRSVLVLVGALAGVVLLVGCGGGAGDSSAGEPGSYREFCLEAREGNGMHGVIKRICAEHGVTESSPPRSSSAAQEARERDAAESAREDQKRNEDPAIEAYNRSAAMADLATGEPDAAREKLAEGCPKSTPTEVEEAFEGLQEIVSGPEASSVEQLEEELEGLCPM